MVKNTKIAVDKESKMLKFKQNLHTHSVLCDGTDKIEDMVIEAVNKGFYSLGFSGHAYTPFSLKYCMTPEETAEYIQEVNRVKEKYKDKIKIFLGTEVDYFSKGVFVDYEYVIGSVHYMDSDGKDEEKGFDTSSAKFLKSRADKYFNGDVYALAEKYYELLADLPNKLAKMDVVGHFDLLMKSCEDERIIDTSNKRYQDAVENCLNRLIKKVDVFEVNTGAIARGYRTEPYPEKWILKKIKEKGGKIILSSDCHKKEMLDCYYEQAIEYIKDCGFDEIHYFDGEKFLPEKI